MSEAVVSVNVNSPLIDVAKFWPVYERATFACAYRMRFVETMYDRYRVSQYTRGFFSREELVCQSICNQLRHFGFPVRRRP